MSRECSARVVLLVVDRFVGRDTELSSSRNTAIFSLALLGWDGPELLRDVLVDAVVSARPMGPGKEAEKETLARVAGNASSFGLMCFYIHVSISSTSKLHQVRKYFLCKCQLLHILHGGGMLVLN